MKNEIVINVGSHESRIAVLEDGKLVEILVECAENERMVGDIYKGSVSAVLPGMQAAFVDIGLEKSAFLHASDMPGSPGSMVGLDEEILEEIDARTHVNGKSVIPIQELIRKGQEVLVQVKKEPIGTKGPRVTAVPSLPGRFMVLVPNGERVGVSRKITNVSEKRRLKELGHDIRPAGYGIIVRTEASGKGDREMMRDLKQLMNIWSRIQKQYRDADAESILHKEMGMTSSLIRDLFTDDVDRLVVDTKQEYKKILAYLKSTSPHLRGRVEYHRDSTPIFDAFGIENEIEKCSDRKVWLKGGGYLVLDHTEALFAIDVNSGRFVGRSNQEENVLKINLEAAGEIPRQLRLRDIGGIIVIDFIDMAIAQNRKKVESEFRQAVRRDRSKPRFSEISEFGLMEMTRQRVRPSLMFMFSESCPNCHGSGRVPSRESTLARIERWLKRSRAASVERRLTVHVNPTVGDFILENRRERLKRLRRSTRVWLNVENDPDLRVDAYRMYSRKRDLDITDKFKT